MKRKEKDEKCLFDTYLAQNDTKNKKVTKFER